jgi:hypothetical protein
MDKQKILDKVSKLLALANNEGASPNEAETALRQARHLMNQYNLESIDVAANGVDETSVPTHTARPPKDWLHRLAATCARAFDCEHLACYVSQTGWSMKFLGKGLGPELAAHAYSALHHQLVASRKSHVAQQKRCQLKTKRRRGELFVDGWLSAVGYKVVQFAGTVDAETTAQIQAYLSVHHPNLKSLDMSRPEAKGHDARSLNAGWEQGKQANLSRGIGRSEQFSIGGGR